MADKSFLNYLQQLPGFVKRTVAQGTPDLQRQEDGSMALHKDIVGENLHVIAYVQAGDPGAVGAGKAWIDNTGGTGTWILKVRNDADDGWETVGGGGGGGVTVFTGLTDTPASYTGKGTYLLAVNAGATGVEFIDPATFALASALSSYLPLAGGIMSGNVQFSDDLEGIQFYDSVSAYFNGMVMNLAEGTLQIGDDAPGLGGPPMIHANSPVMRVGYPSGGAGFATLEMWHQDAGGFVPVATLISDSPGDPLTIGLGDAALTFEGSETKATYNGENLAHDSEVIHVDVADEIHNIASVTPASTDVLLVEDASDSWNKKRVTAASLAGSSDPTVVPHYNKGSGAFQPHIINGMIIWGGTSPATGRISVRDFIHTLAGGVASPSYSFDLDVGSGFIGANSDPTAVYADLTFDDGPTIQVTVRASDGTTTVDTLTYVTVDGAASGP